MSSFRKRVINKAKKEYAKTALEIHAKIVFRTPVGNPDLWNSKAPPGYVGGHARANWQLTIGAPANREVGSEQGVPSIQSQDIVYITNNVPYIVPLEYGHSKQAPNGMVRVTIAEYDNDF